ncbi:hypothetical protein [Draconibacterium halophilum]|uniref:Uncharacterized protein n=1 Tax=Draconibacterium halophilum TaxID=2706887 RepID=A0A6C0RF48_9BACT|nr:hypothetical protein [Draconibacterium halophilum]QIA08586.1 hypothetical protein G0Q07_13050 [Draconibacterium halophilum]
MKKKAKLIILLSILGLAFYCLFVQPELLGINISKSLNFPLGSLIAWLGIVAYVIFFQLIMVPLSKSDLFRIEKVIRSSQFTLALLWLPVSLALSGNMAFTFQNAPHAFKFWVIYTLVILVLPLVLFILKLFGKKVN